MSIYSSTQELLDAVPYTDPELLITNIIPKLDDDALITMHQNHRVLLLSLLPAQQDQLQEHYMSRTLLVIKELDCYRLINRGTLLKLARQYDRKDVIEYVKQRGYY